MYAEYTSIVPITEILHYDLKRPPKRWMSTAVKHGEQEDDRGFIGIFSPFVATHDWIGRILSILHPRLRRPVGIRNLVKQHKTTKAHLPFQA